MIAAAMLAMPLIQKVEQDLATRVGNAASALFAPPKSSASGQNVPSASSSAPASSAQPSAASSLAASLTSTLLNMQGEAVHGHHHHHGAGSYKAAASAVSDLTGQGGAAAPTTAVTA
ncbi:MAG TPA: hypothetical protein VN814_16660 [Caulobacteraceae bacterium]|nr:hypothetical protein [Caulobacteraceae bacterium]